MPTWKELHQKLDDRTTDNTSWASQKKQLHKIFSKAELWGIEANELAEAKVTNLKTVVKCAKSALKHNDKEKLIEIFRLASTLTNTDLRIKLNIVDRDLVKVEMCEVDGEKFYNIVHLTHDQLELIIRAARSSIVFDLIG
jgi:alpha-mannosidase